jgi:hypothetical protein
VTSKRVGEVHVDATLNSGDLRGQLTRDISAKVMPQLKSLNEELNLLKKTMGNVEGLDTFEKIAKQAGIASKEIERTRKASEKFEGIDLARRRAAETATKAIRAQSILYRKMRAEEREFGVASAATAQKYEDAQRSAAIARDARLRQERLAGQAFLEIEQAKLDARQEFETKSRTWHTDELDRIRTRINAIDGETKKIIEAAVRQSDSQIEQGRRAMDDRDVQRKKDTEADRKEFEKRKRNARNYFDSFEALAQKSADLEEKRRRRQSRLGGFSGIGSVAGDAAKSLGSIVGAVTNLGPKVASPAGLIAITALTSGIAQLTAAAATASQVLFTLPAAIGAVGTVAGTVHVALLGVSDTLSAMWAAAEDPKAYADALSKLSPAAQDFVLSLQQAMPALKEVKAAIQDTFFAGIGDAAGPLLDRFVPVIRQVSTLIADEINTALKTVGSTLLTPEVVANIQTFISNLVGGLKLLQPAVEPFTRAMSNLAAEGSRAFGPLLQIITDLATRFSAWVNQASATGELNSLIMQGVNALGMAVGWVEKLVQSWEQLVPVGTDILPMINQFVLSFIEHLPDIIELLAAGASSLKLWVVVLDVIGPLIPALTFAFKGLGGTIDLAMAPLRIGYNLLVKLINAMSHIPGLSGWKDALNEISVMPDTSVTTITGGSPIIPIAGGNTGRAVLGPDGKPLTAADRWLVADAASGNPALPQNAGQLMPGQYRKRDGTIGNIITPSNPDYNLPTEAKAPKGDSPAEIAKKRKDELEAAIPYTQIDPWAAASAPNVVNGMLQVQIPGLNLNPGGYGSSGVPGMMMPGAGPIPATTTGSDPGTIANAIYQSVLQAGYSPDVAKAAVQAGLLESGLSPAARNSGHNSLFQTSSDKGIPDDPAAQIKWFIDELGRQGGPTAANADPLNFIADRIEKGGYPGSRYNEFLDQATNLINPGTPGGIPVVPGMPGMPQIPGGNILGPNNSPGIEQLAEIIKAQFPSIDIGNLGGWRPSDGPNTPTGHQRGQALDIGIGDVTPENQALGDQINEWLRANAGALGIDSTIWRDQWKDFKGNQSTVGGHQNHVHTEISAAMAQSGALGAPGLGGTNVLGMPMGQGSLGAVDPLKLQGAALDLQKAGNDLSKSTHDLQVVQQLFQENLATEQDVIDARLKQNQDQQDLLEKQKTYADIQQGKAAKGADYNALPFGDPRKIIAGAIGGAGGSQQDIDWFVNAFGGGNAGGGIVRRGFDQGGIYGGGVGGSVNRQWFDFMKMIPPDQLNKLFLPGAGGQFPDVPLDLSMSSVAPPFDPNRMTFQQYRWWLMQNAGTANGNLKPAGRDAGGQLPGYSPGVDNMLVPLSGGEGIIIPEAMRALGPDWLYALNSMYRSGISRQGYEGGGVHLGSGALPGPADDTQKTLTQIRDLLQPQAKVNQRVVAQAGSPNANVNGVPQGGPGFLAESLIGSAAAPIGQFFGDVTTNAILGASPQQGGKARAGVLAAGTPTAPNTELNTLLKERNPMALFRAMGFDIPDFTRQGGGLDAQNLTLNGGRPNDATGRIYSDTAALIDRTFTNLDAAEKARFDQSLAVATQTKDRLGSQLLGPTVGAGVTGALQGAAKEIGNVLGNAAAPQIAKAVASAIPADSGQGSEGASLVNTGTSVVNGVLGGFGGMATGGPIFGGTLGVDSVPIMAQHGEFVLNTSDVRRMGGIQGVESYRRSLRAGRVKGFATGGGVIANDYVGAEFFGVSQIPIIGAIVNILVKTLLKVLGVEIEERDTMNEMSKGFREFRGDFQAFDASGRLLNDTSGLIDRSSTSQDTAAAERIRILKIVIEALIKFIIEKLIVPIAKAVGNAFVQAGAGAAGGAIGASFPGGSIVGGAVSAGISSAGSALIEIFGDIGQELAMAVVGTALDAGAEGLQSYFPDLVTGLFGGGLIESLFAAPLAGLFSPFLALLGGISLPFDDGGIANGVGFMPKATIRPERVLDPGDTERFERMVRALERNGGTSSSAKYLQTGDLHFHGVDGPEKAKNKLLALLGD